MVVGIPNPLEEVICVQMNADLVTSNVDITVSMPICAHLVGGMASRTYYV